MGIDTAWTQSEFCCLKHTDRDSAGICKAFQRGCREIGPEFLQDWRPSAEYFATPVENILVRQWNAMQWATRRTCSALAICFSGGLKRRLSFDPHKTIQVLVYFLSVVDAGLGDIERTCVACADQFSNFANTKPGNLQLCHVFIPRCPMAPSMPVPGIVGEPGHYCRGGFPRMVIE
jgi:hypothetical protein